MKNFNILGVYWKIRPLGGGVTKNQYIGGIGQFADLRGGAWQERGVFLRGGWYPNVHYDLKHIMQALLFNR